MGLFFFFGNVAWERTGLVFWGFRIRHVCIWAFHDRRGWGWEDGLYDKDVRNGRMNFMAKMMLGIGGWTS